MMNRTYRILIAAVAVAVLMLAGFAQSGAAAATLTTVTGTVHGPDGSLPGGEIVITAPATFTAADGTTVFQGTVATVTVTNGAFSVALVPNAGSSPAGTSYQALYKLDGVPYHSETWVVPQSASPVDAGQVRSLTLSGPSEMVSSSQLPAVIDQSQIEDHGGQVYDVKSYGAVGDGSHDDTAAIQAAINAAKHGGIVYFPPGVYLYSSTLVFGLDNSGTILQGTGRYYNTVGASVLKWGGAANGTMFQFDGCYYVRLEDMVLDGDSSAGIGLQLVSTASSTGSNNFDRLLLENFTGTPGRAIEIGTTAVANVSENYFDRITVRNTPTPFYQDGAQSFTWLDHFLAGNATDGFNIRNGWVTLSHSEYGGTGNAIRIGNAPSKITVNDMDWEGTGTFMIVEDGTGWNTVNVEDLRALYDANGLAGNIVQIGTGTGTEGTYNFTNCKFSTTYANSPATISVKADAARINFSDYGTTYVSSPSPTSVNFSGPVDYDPANDTLSFQSVPSTLFNDFLDDTGAVGGAIGSASGNIFIAGSSSFTNQNHPGVNQITSGTGGAGTGEFMQLAGTYNVTDLGEGPSWALATDVLLYPITSARFVFGPINGANANPPTEGYYFYYDSSVGPDWHCVTVTGGTATDQDSHVAAEQGSWTDLRMQSDGTTVSFYINNTLVATSTTNLSNQLLRVSWQAIALASSSVYMDVDYVKWFRDVAR